MIQKFGQKNTNIEQWKKLWHQNATRNELEISAQHGLSHENVCLLTMILLKTSDVYLLKNQGRLPVNNRTRRSGHTGEQK